MGCQRQGWRASIQRLDRRLHQDHQDRRRPRLVPWLRHLLRRYLHLPWHVLRSLRFLEAHPFGRRRFLLSFLLGWGVTITAGLMSYPIDTIRRRMMMTSGSAVKYKGSVDCGMQILKNEGFMSMMKG